MIKASLREDSGIYLVMQKTYVLLSACLLSLTLLLTGCSVGGFPGVYKLDIQQGNKITREMLNQLEPGMTLAQVSYVMGAPLLPDSFDKDRWDYIYSYQIGGEKIDVSKVALLFKDGRLSEILYDADDPAFVDMNSVNDKNKELGE